LVLVYKGGKQDQQGRSHGEGKQVLKAELGGDSGLFDSKAQTLSYLPLAPKCPLLCRASLKCSCFDFVAKLTK
jgi:hypothetical protein